MMTQAQLKEEITFQELKLAKLTQDVKDTKIKLTTLNHILTTKVRKPSFTPLRPERVTKIR